MVNLVVPEQANRNIHFLTRLKYTAEVVFKHVLNTTYRFLKGENNSFEGISLFYQNFPPPQINPFSDRNLYIFDSGYLSIKNFTEKDFHPPIADHDGVAILFPAPDSGKGFDLPFDLFSACFFLLTEPENHFAPKFDAHGRYDEKHSFILKNNLHEHPLVHIYCEALWQQLKERQPKLGRSYPQFAVKYTFDADQPFKYLHKPLTVQLGGGVKDLLNGNFKGLQERTRTHLTRKDPNHTFETIFERFPSDDTTIFFLLDGKSPHDSRFRSTQKVIRDLVRRCRDWGAEVGVHPSYHTATQPDLLKKEIETLKEILGERIIIASRQHFLKYRLPQTYRTLAECGVRYDYTTCFASQTGFKHGMARPFPYYDLLKDEATSLLLHPTQVMDRTLISYLQCDPMRGEKIIRDVAMRTRSVGGILTLLFHNEIFSDSGEWKGWERIAKMNY